MEEYIDLSGDGGVQKRILQEGTGDEKPSKGCSVSLHYTGTLDADGKKFDSSRDRNEPFQFTLGQGSVIKAFDMGVASMKLGEKCILKCAPQYAYGSSGSPPNIPPNATLNFELEKFHKEETSRLILKPQYAFGAEGNAGLGVPANATVEYTVTLQDFECLVERSMMSPEEMLAQAKLLREKGTKYLKEEKPELALKLYERALTFLFDQSAETEAMKLAIYLNKILCLQKMKDHDEAKVACGEALNLDSKNVKALYRRGMSNLALGDLDRALQDFTAVLDIEPENKAALNQVTICKHKIKEYNDQQKKVFANMFTKFAQSDSK